MLIPEPITMAGGLQYRDWSDSSTSETRESWEFVISPFGATSWNKNRVNSQRKEWRWRMKRLKTKTKAKTHLEQSALQNRPFSCIHAWTSKVTMLFHRRELVNVWNNWRSGEKPYFVLFVRISWCIYFTSKANVKLLTSHPSAWKWRDVQ